jgi:hypothetical protein
MLQNNLELAPTILPGFAKPCLCVPIIRPKLGFAALEDVPLYLLTGLNPFACHTGSTTEVKFCFIMMDEVLQQLNPVAEADDNLFFIENTREYLQAQFE